jgi:hypothetical protein
VVEQVVARRDGVEHLANGAGGAGFVDCACGARAGCGRVRGQRSGYRSG